MTSYFSDRFCVILCTDGLSCSFITLYPWLPIVLPMSAARSTWVEVMISPHLVIDSKIVDEMKTRTVGVASRNAIYLKSGARDYITVKYFD